MAEALLKRVGGDQFDVESAGLEPGSLNPLAVEAMKEIGVDISKNKTKSVFDMFKRGKLYHYVVTVCDETSAERCPIFPGVTKRLHWSFEDPAGLSLGTHDEKLRKTREIRDQIEAKIKEFVQQVSLQKV
jgi:arsenate reductase